MHKTTSLFNVTDLPQAVQLVYFPVETRFLSFCFRRSCFPIAVARGARDGLPISFPFHFVILRLSRARRA